MGQSAVLITNAWGIMGGDTGMTRDCRQNSALKIFVYMSHINNEKLLRFRKNRSIVLQRTVRQGTSIQLFPISARSADTNHIYDDYTTSNEKSGQVDFELPKSEEFSIDKGSHIRVGT